jgi:hypothetical protein
MPPNAHLYDLDPAYKPLINRIGGIKGICSKHSERLQYVGNAGGGVVPLEVGKDAFRRSSRSGREYPIRPGEPDCFFFLKSGACKAKVEKLTTHSLRGCLQTKLATQPRP